MRKALAMAAVLVGLAACTGNWREWVTVRFEVGVESGDLAVKSEGGVVELLQETRPTGSIELSLEGVDVDCDAVVESGEVVELMAGRYRVTGRYVPDGSEGSVIGFVAQEPFYVVDSEVEVRTDLGSYVVNGAYDCWALVLDTEDTDEYWGDGCTVEGFYGEGRYRVLYVSGSPPEWTLTVLPLDESLYDATDFEMGKSRQLNGRWYCYHPGRGESSGRFGVVLPEWVEGVDGDCYIEKNRYICAMSFQGKTTKELEVELRKKMDEVYRLRMEIDRRKGDMPQGKVDVDFEKYVKDGD